MNQLRRFSVVLSFLNGIAACFGGISYLTRPIGTEDTKAAFLARTFSFGDYFIPGPILLVVIGIGSLATGRAAILKTISYTILITMMESAIAIWIMAQMLMLRIVCFLHFVIGGIGITLLVLGIIQWQITDFGKKA